MVPVDTIDPATRLLGGLVEANRIPDELARRVHVAGVSHQTYCRIGYENEQLGSLGRQMLRTAAVIAPTMPQQAFNLAIEASWRAQCRRDWNATP